MIAALLEKTETASRFTFDAAPRTWIRFLVILPLLVLYCLILYRNRSVPTRGKRWLLGILRFLSVALLVLAIFKPVIEKIRTREVKDQVVFLFDNSASMGRIDGYTGEELRRLSSLLSGESTEAARNLSRLEIVKRIFGGPQGILSAIRKRFDTLVFAFSREFLPIASLRDLNPTGKVTRPGEALRAAFLESAAGRTVGVVVVSDGKNNDGISPLDALAPYVSEGIPVHTILCGKETPIKNIAVMGINAPNSVLQREKASFKVSTRSEGLGGKRFTIVLLNGETNEVLESKEYTIPMEGGDQMVMFNHRFDDPGEYTLKVKIYPLPGESFLDDNVSVHHLVVVSGKIRVLYIEDYPRWEYRSLKDSLLRAFNSIEGQCFLMEATPDFIQESTKGLPHLKDIPRTREELFKNYHVVILGDVDPSLLGATPEEAKNFMLLLKEFVEYGGGLVCQAGVRAMPDAYRGTPIEDLLPVVLLDPGEFMEGIDTKIPFHPVIENPGSPHQILKLLPNIRMNNLLWNEGLEGFYWYAPVRRARAGATVLLRHPTKRNKYGRHVLAAAWEYPLGRVVYLGLDSFWRWQKYYGNKHKNTFWRNVIRYASEGKLRRGSDRAEIVLAKQVFDVGERMEIIVRLRTEDVLPSKAPSCKVFFVLPDGKGKQAVLRADPREPGSFRGSFKFRIPGSYSVTIRENDEPGAKILAAKIFHVRVPKKELSSPLPDSRTMKRMAGLTRGTFLKLSEAGKILDVLPRGGKRRIPVGKDPHPRELWDTPFLLMILVLLLGLEWILRKGVNLP